MVIVALVLRCSPLYGDMIHCVHFLSILPLVPTSQTYGYPLMLKSRKMAYDGRGNAVVRSEADIAAAWDQLASKGQLYSERWVPFKRELAVIVARSIKGECVSYDAVETVQKNNICHVVVSPAQLPGNVLSRAREVAAKAVAGLAGAGVYGVELFELDDGSILLNEIAPRVHNSGHFTIEACNTSQFEQHIRCIVGLPLGSPAMRVGASVMINVLGTGATEADAGTTWDICQRALATPGASVHWYGKKGVALGRKVGHITLTGQWMPDVIAAATALIDGPVPRDAASSSSPSWSTSRAPVVGIIMGSDSDLPCMQAAAQTLEDFGVPFELTVVSAHRTPKRLFDYATSARSRGLKVIIAAAGGAAHLPGMVAAMTPLPVIGVPVPLKHLDGVDSLYSIVQMPRGVPVATVAIGNSTNAGLLAVRMLGSFVGSIGDGMEKYQSKIEDEVLAKVETLEAAGWKNYNVGAHK